MARDLNNLAQLLKATNRLAEAEPLSRRQLKIFIQFKRRAGHEHPRFQTALGNYIGILEAQGLIKDQVQARIREISIEVAEESGGDRPASPEA